LLKAQAQPIEHLKYLPGQLLVKVSEKAVRPQIGTARIALGASSAGLLPEVVTEPLDFLRQTAGLKSMEPIFSTRRAQLRRADVTGAERVRLAAISSVSDSPSERLAGITACQVDPKEVTPSLLSTLNASQGIDFAEMAPARWVAADRDPSPDPQQNLQWGLRAIQWFEANRPDASGVEVAVLDTGIDARHPDFKGVTLSYHHEGLKAEDIVGHGTHVAGIIGAKANNRVGIAGVANCSLSAWKIFSDTPEADGEYYVDPDRYIRALGQVLAANIRVVNLSITGTAKSQTEGLILGELDRAGITVVAAMGNYYERGNPTMYPAAFPNVLGIGAIDQNRERSPFSNTGRSIGLVAPGSSILSTLPTRKSSYRSETSYASWSGTSMATPHVAAAAALMLARDPTAYNRQIEDGLRGNAAHLPAMRRAKWTQRYGNGLLNLQRTLS
jgi:subtilisin family serine protease